MSSNIFCQLREVNYHDKLLDLIRIRNDISTFEEVTDLVENKYLVTGLIENFQKNHTYTERWLKSIFKFIDYIDITAFDNSLLIYSSRSGFYDFVKYLIEKGTNIHARNDVAFVCAGLNNHFKVVKYLLKKGANIHADDEAAFTSAAFHGKLEIVKFLVERPDCKVCHKQCIHGADIHADNDYALKWAARNGHLEIVKYLIEKGADKSVLENYISKYSRIAKVINYLESL